MSSTFITFLSSVTYHLARNSWVAATLKSVYATISRYSLPIEPFFPVLTSQVLLAGQLIETMDRPFPSHLNLLYVLVPKNQNKPSTLINDNIYNTCTIVFVKDEQRCFRLSSSECCHHVNFHLWWKPTCITVTAPYVTAVQYTEPMKTPPATKGQTL